MIIENTFELINGVSEATAWVDEEAKLHLVYKDASDGKLYHSEQALPVGGMTTVSMARGTQFAADRDVTGLVSRHYPGHKTWFIWHDANGNVKEAVYVDEPYANETKSPYKLYYAVDTEKLYMNIDDNWEFIGSPNVESLHGLNDYIGYVPGTEDVGEGSVDLAPILSRIQQLEDALANNIGGGGAAAPENLFKTSEMVEGYLVISSSVLGAMDATRKEHTSDYISVDAGELVTIQNWVTPIGSSSTEYLWMAYQLYDANKSLSGTRLAFTPNTKVLSDGTHHRSIGLLIPDGVHFIRVSARLYNDGKISVVKTVPLTEWTES